MILAVSDKEGKTIAGSSSMFVGIEKPLAFKGSANHKSMSSLKGLYCASILT